MSKLQNRIINLMLACFVIIMVSITVIAATIAVKIVTTGEMPAKYRIIQEK